MKPSEKIRDDLLEESGSDRDSSVDLSAEEDSRENSLVIEEDAKAHKRHSRRKRVVASIEADDSDNSERESRKSRQKQRQKAEKLRRRIESQKTARQEDDFSLEGEETVYGIRQLRLARKKRLLGYCYNLLLVLTLGFAQLVTNWLRKRLRHSLLYKEVTALEEATTVILLDAQGRRYYIALRRKKLYVSELLELDTYAFVFNYQTYFWNSALCRFQNIRRLTEKKPVRDFLAENRNGRADDEVDQLKETYGQNLLRLHAPSAARNFFELLAHPIATFELLSLFVLYYLHYRVYFCFTLLYILYQLIHELHQTSLAARQLQKSCLFNEKVMVIRQTKNNVHKKKIIDSAELVPGDLIEITNNLLLPADVVLIYGSCIVQDNLNSFNDSTETKIAIDEKSNCALSEIPSKNLLITGNRVLYTINHINEGCFGLVISTGFNTIKGNNLCCAIRPKPLEFVYKRDSYLLFMLLAAIALVTALGLVTYEAFILRTDLAFNHTLTKLFQLLIIALKPAIPIALLAPLNYAVGRLEGKGVRVHNKNKLNEIGKSTTVVIEDKVVVSSENETVGFLICKHNEANYKTFDKLVTSKKKLFRSIESKPIIKKYVEGYGLCNIVTKMGEEYYGPQIDIEMLRNSAFDISYKIKDKGNIDRYLSPLKDAPDCFSSEYKVLRYFEYQKGRREYVSLIIENAEGELYLYTKGEPSDFGAICSKASMPYNYSLTIAKCSNKGYKCTALAFKKLEREQLWAGREELETELNFLGFYLTNTTVKERTTDTVKELRAVGINFVMLSEGSVFLAIANARKAQLFTSDAELYLGRTETINNVETLLWQQLTKKQKDSNETFLIHEPIDVTDKEMSSEEIILNSSSQIALTGQALRLILENASEELAAILLKKCVVYGNLTGEDSAYILRRLRRLDSEHPVSYVNNGVSSLSAINEADVSVAMAETNTSSINSFCSTNADIADLTEIIRESRTNLYNKHKNFGFVLYFVSLQYIGLLVLFSQHTNYAASHILIMDIVIILAASYFQASFGPRKLTTRIPNRSIFSQKFLTYISTIVVYSATVLLCLVWLLWKTKFYKTPLQIAKHHGLSVETHRFYEPFVVFIFLCMLGARYVIGGNMKYIFSRKVISNLPFLLYVLGLTVGPLVLLFSSALYSRTLAGHLTRAFRIPYLHGFEVLITMIFVLTLFGFYAVRHIEQKLHQLWKEKTVEEAEKPERSEKATLLSVSNRFSGKDSRAHKKSRASRGKRRARKLEKRSVASKSIRSGSNASKWERKEKPSRKRAAKFE